MDNTHDVTLHDRADKFDILDNLGCPLKVNSTFLSMNKTWRLDSLEHVHEQIKYE